MSIAIISGPIHHGALGKTYKPTFFVDSKKLDFLENLLCQKKEVDLGEYSLERYRDEEDPTSDTPVEIVSLSGRIKKNSPYHNAYYHFEFWMLESGSYLGISSLLMDDRSGIEPMTLLFSDWSDVLLYLGDSGIINDTESFLPVHRSLV